MFAIVGARRDPVFHGCDRNVLRLGCAQPPHDDAIGVKSVVAVASIKLRAREPTGGLNAQVPRRRQAEQREQQESRDGAQHVIRTMATPRKVYLPTS